MLINPPIEEPEPEQPTTAVEFTEFHDRWIKFYLDCPNWKCPECNTTMFGRSKYCAYCKLKLNKHTPRPDSYKENTYAEVYYGSKDGRKIGE